MTIRSADVVVENPAIQTPMGAHLARPAGAERRPAIIVAHELFGVNPDIRGVVAHLAELGYVALAPEFYHRESAPGASLERNEEGRGRGFELLRGLTRDGVLGDVAAAMDFLREEPSCDGRIGMLGFSMGGHIAYLAATQLDLAATAVLYGGWLTGTEISLSRPTRTLDLTPGIAAQRGRLLYVVGGHDALIDEQQIAAIRGALAQAGVPYEMVVLPDVAHAFFWEGTPAFDRAARDETWRRLTSFFAAGFAARAAR